MQIHQHQPATWTKQTQALTQYQLPFLPRELVQSDAELNGIKAAVLQWWVLCQPGRAWLSGMALVRRSEPV